MISQTGLPHSRTLRKPGLYTAKTIAVDAKIQNTHYPRRHHNMPLGSVLQYCRSMRWPPIGCGNGAGVGKGICANAGDAESIAIKKIHFMDISYFTFAQYNAIWADCK